MQPSVRHVNFQPDASHRASGVGLENCVAEKPKIFIQFAKVEYAYAPWSAEFDATREHTLKIVALNRLSTIKECLLLLFMKTNMPNINIHY